MADLGFIKRRPIATLLLCTTEPKREVAVVDEIALFSFCHHSVFQQGFECELHTAYGFQVVAKHKTCFVGLFHHIFFRYCSE